jgi:hypothetical protein
MVGEKVFNIHYERRLAEQMHFEWRMSASIATREFFARQRHLFILCEDSANVAQCRQRKEYSNAHHGDDLSNSSSTGRQLVSFPSKAVLICGAHKPSYTDGNARHRGDAMKHHVLRLIRRSVTPA